jgi:endonuclease/exonuclease/phosphatase (EEP) superfamily protein YafD
VRAGRARWVERLGWVIVVFVGGVMLTQVAGWTGFRIVAVIQSVTPYLGVLLVPVGVIALWTRRLVLATTVVAIGFGGLLLATPLAVPIDAPDAADGATGLRIASLNLLYRNDRIGQVADQLDALAPDVIVLSEYTEEHQTALEQHRLVDAYPHRVDRTGQFAGGIAIWSRTPVAVSEHPDTATYSLDLTVDGPDGPTRIVAMHVPTPLDNFSGWQDDLEIAAEIGRAAVVPMVLIGDLNASYWHPGFRRLLDAGFVDAHTASGRGFSASWPTNRFFPPFVRLDHALTTGGLVATDVDDFEIPGSDHRGFVVTVAPAAPATP